jgi:hypothetical protein
MKWMVGSLALVLALAAPPGAEAQSTRDSVLDGVAIGGAIAAVGGFIIAPYALCGGDLTDSECVVIVRAAVGIPVLAGGLVVGGLVDKYHARGPVVWRSANGGKTLRVGRFANGGTGVTFQMRFK